MITRRAANPRQNRQRMLASGAREGVVVRVVLEERRMAGGANGAAATPALPSINRILQLVELRALPLNRIALINQRLYELLIQDLLFLPH